ncbi:hypothetical protein ACMGD3_11080 [Lysinibacillus sphaericus]|uniref:hypothetical protein n=1 Tax=Lysinibacillus sphaericus TaxID=1421 RepID=UPI001C5CEDE1
MIDVMARMKKNSNNERNQLEMLTIDQMVPEDHLVRKLEAALDFNFIYSLYSKCTYRKG